MKVFINVRDLLSWPRKMADKLAAEGHTPILVDNASTYPPLLEYYKTSPHRVVLLGANAGAYAPWIALSDEMTEHYVVTDHDLDLSAVPADWADIMVRTVDRFGCKCGLSLEDADFPEVNAEWMRRAFNCVRGSGCPDMWPIVGFDRKTGTAIHGAAVDTTFAVYPPNWVKTSLANTPAVRVGRPYIARHVPWHLVEKLTGAADTHEVLIDDEFRYYGRNGAAGVSAYIRNYGVEAQG